LLFSLFLTITAAKYLMIKQLVANQ